jgi:DNA invertase Pin-like site-specific DNA recombinase
MIETYLQDRRLGYARVSTYGQTLDAQLEQLRADGCAKVYREKASGAQADRRELLRLLKDITPGDVVTVTRIDRLVVRLCNIAQAGKAERRSAGSPRRTRHGRYA